MPVLDMSGLKNLHVPVSLFVGKHDTLSTEEDDQKLRDMLGDALSSYQVVQADHLSLMLGSNMDYFTRDVMQILAKK